MRRIASRACLFPFVLGVLAALSWPSEVRGQQTGLDEADLAAHEREFERLEAALAVPLRIHAHMAFLASDAMGGRDTATVHGEIAAEYVSSVFRAIGLEPAGDGDGYLQRYPLISSRLDVEGLSLELRGDEGHLVGAFTPDTDYALRGYGSESLIDLSGSVVFVGHGLVDAECCVDDYAGVDVEGRWVMLLSGAPEGRDDLRAAASSRAKRNAARDRGALGLLHVSQAGDTGAGRMFHWARRLMQGSAMSLDLRDEPPGDDWEGVINFATK